ncbi:MAG: extracellular solute-binding protein [Blautia sp.]|nr:extracellular solute-binding protein [Blautia sp.]
MNRKTLSLVLTAAMLSSAAAAIPAAAEENVTVSIMCAYASEDPHGQYVYQYAEAFNAANPGITVEIQAISSNDIYAKLASMATSPDDLPTLFWSSVDMAPSELDIGIVESLDEYLDEETKASFANGVLEGASFDGKIAFYPIDVQPSAVIYRKDRFDEAGLSVPTTWEEFLECARALTLDSDGDGEIDQWGFSMVGSNNSSGQSRFMSYLWSCGNDIVRNEDGEWVSEIDNDKFLADFSFWTDLYTVEGVVPTSITEVDYATAANYFAMGYTSIILSGSNAIGVAYNSNPDLKGSLGSFVIPGDAPGTMLNAEGYALCTYASDEEKAAAVEFLKFFSNNDPELGLWQASGKIPATIEGQKAEYIVGDDYAGYLGTIEAGTVPTLNFPGFAALKTALGDAYSAVFAGQSTNEEAVKALAKEVDSMLEDYN